MTQIWYPRAAGRFPLLLFAPGFLQCPAAPPFTVPSWSFRTVRCVRVEEPDETWLPGGYGDRSGPLGENGSGMPRRAERRAVLLVMLAVEGVTVLRVRGLLSPHVFIGVVLIPPVLVKVGSTGWRFARYYAGAPAYRRKGPPPVLLRMLGPVVAILTLVLLFSGVGLLLAGPSWLPLLLKVHKASFVLWFAAMTIHVLGHMGEVFRLARRDWLRRTRREVTGAGTRQWLIAASLVAGVMLGFLLLSHIGHWLSAAPGAAR